MISKKIQDQLNGQLGAELHSAYAYFAMATYCRLDTRPGAAKWFDIQSREEMGHAKKIYDYLIEQGAEVKLAALASPKVDFKSILEVFEYALAQEKNISESIRKLMNSSVEEKDFATQIFLQWFVTEQVEEESLITDVLTTIKRLGDSESALCLVDRYLSERAE